MTDVIVVGSGASGVNAAAPLVNTGLSVMLDFGNEDRHYAPLIPSRPFEEIRRTDRGQHRYFLGDLFEGIPFRPVRAAQSIGIAAFDSDLRSFGCNPYAPEFAALIRAGKADRRQWTLMAPLVDFLIRQRLGPGREVTRSLRWLNLEPDMLKITRPRGAYDPLPAPSS